MAQDFPPPPDSPPQKHNTNAAWIGGLVLIVIGIVFLLQNLNLLGPLPLLRNWWALFILIPAVGAFLRVAQDIQANGRLTGLGRGSLISGLFMGFVSAVFLFDLNWAVIWPIFLIIAGVGALLGVLYR
ncbi:MAG TPA: hypothetical protein VGJ97_03415 [Anaerolineaceae bacterium]|jgi:hypothetical protein